MVHVSRSLNFVFQLQVLFIKLLDIFADEILTVTGLCELKGMTVDLIACSQEALVLRTITLLMITYDMITLHIQ